MTDSFNINSLSRGAEEWFGIKADPDDLKKLQAYLWNTYGRVNSEILKQAFLSGEAAGFLTVNETYFFREPAHFALLQDFLPSFEQSGIRICSAATASGCEAYSIAMLIEEYNKGRSETGEKPLSYHIDAFDINPKVLELAHQGIYSARAMREDGSGFHYMANPYLKSLADAYQIDPSLKNNISFFVHNLMNEIPRTGSKAYDFIFFRNAFIYFFPQNRGRILSNLSAVLKPGGILIMGVSETAGVHHDDFIQKNKNDVFYFEKLS
jgi:chemotaxis protein methyltransferase CheR